MNYIIKNFAEKVKANIEGGIYTHLNMSEENVIMYGHYVFAGITFPNKQIRDAVIEEFNNSNFSSNNKIKISVYSENGKERIVALFK